MADTRASVAEGEVGVMAVLAVANVGADMNVGWGTMLVPSLAGLVVAIVILGEILSAGSRLSGSAIVP